MNSSEFCYVCKELVDDERGTKRCTQCRNCFHGECVETDRGEEVHERNKSSWRCTFCVNSSTPNTTISESLKGAYDFSLNDVIDFLVKINAQCSEMQQKIDVLSQENRLLKEEISKINHSDCSKSASSVRENYLNQTEAIRNKPTFAQVLGNKSAFIVKPIDSQQSNNKTKLDIVENIDPVDLNIQVSQLKQIKDGGILIKYDNSVSAKNFKCAAEQKLSKDYRITELKKPYPRIRVVGFDKEYTCGELLRFLRGQNDVLPVDHHLNVLKVWGTKKKQ